MQVNDKVADFTLQTEEDKTVHLKDYAGKPVVLFSILGPTPPVARLKPAAFVTSSRRYSRLAPSFWAFPVTPQRRRRNSKKSTTCPTPS